MFASWQVGELVWAILWFTMFFIWIWLLISVFGDIFRSPDLSGWGKALWTVFVIFLPLLGVLVYLIARGHKMQEHAVARAKAQDAAARQYIQSVAPPTNPTDEIAKATKLLESGAITQAEFDAIKAKAMS